MAKPKLDYKTVGEALEAKAITILTTDTSTMTDEQRKARREDATDTIIDCNMLGALAATSLSVVTTIEGIKTVPLLNSLKLIQALRSF